MNTKLVSLTAIAAMTLAPLAAQAQTFTDNASNYTGGYNGGQGGSTPGFSAFKVTAAGTSSGTFVYTAANSEGGNGTPAPSSIDSKSVSFGIYANTDATSSTTITRAFAAPKQASGLNVTGDTFSLDFLTGYNDGNAAGTSGGSGDGSGFAGVSLLTAAGTVGTFDYQSSDQYFFNGAQVNKADGTKQDYTTGAFHLLYTLTSATTYSFQASGPFTFTGTGTLSGPVTGFEVQQANSGGGGPEHDAFFNNIAYTAVPAAVPEASSLIGFGLLLTLGGVAVAVRKRTVQA